MRTKLIEQIKRRRIALEIKTSDMPKLAGINRQQYEKIEKSGNPSLSTLDKIAEAIDAEVMLIPKERAQEIHEILRERSREPGVEVTAADRIKAEQEGYVIDPWALIEQNKIQPT